MILKTNHHSLFSAPISSMAMMTVGSFFFATSGRLSVQPFVADALETKVDLFEKGGDENRGDKPSGLLLDQLQENAVPHLRGIDHSLKISDNEGSEARNKDQSEIFGMCNDDGDCDSGDACCPSWYLLTFVGFCQACCDDADCLAKIEQPPAGEWGERFCIDSTCQAFRDGESSQVPDNAYQTWMPSETIDNAREYHEQIVPRYKLSETPEPVYEQFYYFDFNEQEESFDKDSIVYNGTHIKIPTWTKIHAGYAKSYHAYDEHESGIVTLVTGPNDYSLVADYPKSWLIEKYHTLTYDGKIDTSRGDYIKELSDEGMKTEWNAGAWMSRAYSHALDLFMKGVIMSQVEAGLDKALSWQIRRYVNSYLDEDVGTLNPSTSSSWANNGEKAKQAITHAKNVDFERDFKKSELHCKHFEEGTGVDADADYITLPLGRPVTTLSGEMVFSPVHYFGVVAGHVTADYNEEENVLQLYYQGFGQSRQYLDPKFPGPYPTALYVSPVAEGSDYAVDADVDGRSDNSYISEKPSNNGSPLFGWSPYDDVADFSLWARPRSETCDPYIEDSDIWEDIHLTPGNANIYEYLMSTKDILQGAVEAAPCANIWMRSDYGAGTHGFGISEISLWVHTMTETLDTRTKEFTTADWWDNWDCFYKNKDPTLCA